MTTGRITVLAGILVFSIALMVSCSKGIDESALDIDKLCALAESEFSKQDLGALLPEMEKQFHVDRKKMRITEQGVYISVKSRFVEESGYFIIRPGVNIILRVGDPMMVRVKGCVFRYRIKG